MRQSIEAIKEMTDPNGISFQIPADYFGVIAKANNPNMDIYEAEIQVSKIDIQGILSKVTNRLLDILIQLEKEFGCLDELDICVKSKSEDELREIKNNIYVIIFDKRVTLGNNNEIKSSTIASEFTKN